MQTLEQIAEENERRIVRFTNIDKESFTHAFRGIKITIGAGETYMGRFPECDHLALHLARKMTAREKKAKGADKDPRGAVLYTDEEINDLKAKILSDVGSVTPEHLTPEEERKQDLQRIQQKFSSKKEPPVVDKADIIQSLKDRGIEPDISKSKDELLQELMVVEAKTT